MNNSFVALFSDKQGYLLIDGTWEWSPPSEVVANYAPDWAIVTLRDGLESLRPELGNVNIVWAHNNAIAYYENRGWSEWTHALS